MQSHFLNMTACCQLLTDILESRKDVVHLSNPYQKCPVYETSSFLLRLVQLDDAKDLLACYSDRRAVANMNADCCTSDFYYETLTQMQECIRFWLREYQQQAYIRFAIIDFPAPGGPNNAIFSMTITFVSFYVLIICFVFVNCATKIYLNLNQKSETTKYFYRNIPYFFLL